VLRGGASDKVRKGEIVTDTTTGASAGGEQPDRFPFGDIAPEGVAPQAITIAGYLDDSGTRPKLYLDESGRTYAEFDREGLVTTRPVSGAALGGGVVCYLRPDANVTHVQTQSASIGTFMQGALTKSAVAEAVGQADGQATPQFLGALIGTIGGAVASRVTKYDSILWCQSRFMCNPQSVSCLC
jgi:hypothetical protein